MLLKCVGIIFIISSCGLFGFLLSSDFVGRIKELEQIRKMLVFLKGEIKYNNSGIGTAIDKVEQNMDSTTNAFLKYVSEQFDGGKISIKNAWNNGLEEMKKNKSKLKDEDIELLKEVGSNLGITDRETQIGNINREMEIISIKISELNQEKKEKCKLYKTFGVMSGIFIAIIII